MRQEPTFVVCGEALMDVFPSSGSGREETEAKPGGSPFNVAVGLARMAQTVAFFSAVSRDALGNRLIHALLSEGVDTSSVARTDAPTTRGIVTLDAEGVPAYAFDGKDGADRHVSVSDLAQLPEKYQALHLGSYSLVVQPAGSVLRELTDRVRGRVLVSYDPNVRLNIVPDEGRWRDVLTYMLPRTDVLKLSEEDLHVLRPGVSPETFAAEARDAGVALVVVTRGAEGAVAWTRETHVRVDAVNSVVIDTVGAGDTFTAALLTWLAEHRALVVGALGGLSEGQLAAAVHFASRAAAITCARRGANLPLRDELI